MPAVVLAKSLPQILTDVDYAFDFFFFDGDLETPHFFDLADTAEFRFSALWGSESAQLVLSEPPTLVRPTANSFGMRMPAAAIAAGLLPGAYAFQLRRFDAAGGVDGLALGRVEVMAGLSTRTDAPGGAWMPSAAPSAAVNIIYGTASAQIVFQAPPPIGAMARYRNPPTDGSSITIDALDNGGHVAVSASDSPQMVIFNAAALPKPFVVVVTKDDDSAHEVTISLDGMTPFYRLTQPNEPVQLRNTRSGATCLPWPPNV